MRSSRSLPPPLVGNEFAFALAHWLVAHLLIAGRLIPGQLTVGQLTVGETLLVERGMLMLQLLIGACTPSLLLGDPCALFGLSGAGSACIRLATVCRGNIAAARCQFTLTCADQPALTRARQQHSKSDHDQDRDNDDHDDYCG